eukprot:1159621-Pelagomonas_calceolata.AAC.6
MRALFDTFHTHLEQVQQKACTVACKDCPCATLRNDGCCVAAQRLPGLLASLTQCLKRQEVPVGLQLFIKRFFSSQCSQGAQQIEQEGNTEKVSIQIHSQKHTQSTPGWHPHCPAPAWPALGTPSCAPHAPCLAPAPRLQFPHRTPATALPLACLHLLLPDLQHIQLPHREAPQTLTLPGHSCALWAEQALYHPGYHQHPPLCHPSQTAQPPEAPEAAAAAAAAVGAAGGASAAAGRAAGGCVAAPPLLA